MPTFPGSARPITLKDLAKDETHLLLARAWSDPLGLDPTRHSAKVTREIADKLAKLAKSFESAGHHAEVVAAFLMRCLFTFFAENVGLIDKERADEQPFTDLLKTLRGHCDQFVPMAQDVWGRMDAGGFSTAMRRKLKHFNGPLKSNSRGIGGVHRHAAEAQALQRRPFPGIARAAGDAGATRTADPGRRE